jgi:hypothetical protein
MFLHEEANASPQRKSPQESRLYRIWCFKKQTTPNISQVWKVSYTKHVNVASYLWDSVILAKAASKPTQQLCNLFLVIEEAGHANHHTKKKDSKKPKKGNLPPPPDGGSTWIDSTLSYRSYNSPLSLLDIDGGGSPFG